MEGHPTKNIWIAQVGLDGTQNWVEKDGKGSESGKTWMREGTWSKHFVGHSQRTNKKLIGKHSVCSIWKGKCSNTLDRKLWNHEGKKFRLISYRVIKFLQKNTTKKNNIVLNWRILSQYCTLGLRKIKGLFQGFTFCKNGEYRDGVGWDRK